MKYQTAATVAHDMTRPAPSRDTTRAHAINYAVAWGVLALCGGVLAWTVAKVAGARVTVGHLATVPLLAIGTAGIAGAIKLIVFTEEHRDWLYLVEKATQRDLDGDGKVGHAQVETLRVEVKADADAGRRWELSDLPITRAQLATIAKSTTTGAHKLSRRDLATLPGIGSDRARDILTQLEQGGFTHYPNGRNHPDGAQWTAKGRALCRALLE